MLPRYAYDFSVINPVEETTAKKRVIQSMARHYEAEAPETYYNREQVKADTAAALQSIEKIRAGVALLSSAVHEQELAGGNRGRAFISQQSYNEYLKNLEKINLDIEALARTLGELLKNIINIDIADLLALADAFEGMYKEYKTVADNDTYFYTRGKSPMNVFKIKANNMKIDFTKMRDAWGAVVSKMEDAREVLDNILEYYNERRRNLFSRAELQGSGLRAYSLSAETYEPSEYV